MSEVGWTPKKRTSASTPMSLCFNCTRNDLIFVVVKILSSSVPVIEPRVSSAMRTAITAVMCVTILPAVELMTSLMNASAPKRDVASAAIPSAIGMAMPWQATINTASRYRTFGRVTGLLSPQGDKASGIFIAVFAVRTVERITLPKTESPMSLFIVFVLCSSFSFPDAATT